MKVNIYSYPTRVTRALFLVLHVPLHAWPSGSAVFFLCSLILYFSCDKAMKKWWSRVTNACTFAHLSGSYTFRFWSIWSFLFWFAVFLTFFNANPYALLNFPNATAKVFSILFIHLSAYSQFMHFRRFLSVVENSFPQSSQIFSYSGIIFHLVLL